MSIPFPDQSRDTDALPHPGSMSAPKRTSLRGRIFRIKVKARLSDQLLAAGQQYVHDATDRLAILDLQGCDGHLIARLHGRLGPADVEHRRRILRLHNPRHNLTAVIFNVVVTDAMGSS